MILFRACLVGFLAIASAGLYAQDSKAAEAKSAASQSAHPAAAFSGMYGFLNDGEFVQISVEDDGKVTGFVSRYDGSDKGNFVDQYFRSARMEGNKLSFTTETSHGIWCEFKGTVERGEGKNPGDEGYHVLQGTLSDNSIDAQKKITTNSRVVEFKMFPAESAPRK